MTREDLVVVVKCEEQHSTLVQHADGTHIYSEDWEFFPPDPVEVVGLPEHIFGEWPSSCKDIESINKGDAIDEDQINSGEQRTSITNANAGINEDDTRLLETETKTKTKIVKDDNLPEKVENEGDCEKKQPLRGLLGELPTKLGIELSDFANAQKKHSQTWAPEGYGNAPRETPKWIWPPPPPGLKKRRYNTPPRGNDKVLAVEPLVKKEPEHSIVWHVRKDGLPKVHGKVQE